MTLRQTKLTVCTLFFGGLLVAPLVARWIDSLHDPLAEFRAMERAHEKSLAEFKEKEAARLAESDAAAAARVAAYREAITRSEREYIRSLPPEQQDEYLAREYDKILRSQAIDNLQEFRDLAE